MIKLSFKNLTRRTVVFASIAFAVGCDLDESIDSNSPISSASAQEEENRVFKSADESRDQARPGDLLQVKIRLASGAADRIPPNGVLVMLTQLSHAQGAGPGQKTQYRGWVRRDGQWYGPSLPRGRYRVSARAVGKATAVDEILDYSHPNHLPPLNLDIVDELRVIVRIIDKKTKLYIHKARVALKPIDCKGLCDQLAAAPYSGSFVRDRIKPGTYELTIEAPGYMMQPASRIRLTEAVSVIERSLERGTAAHGRLVFASRPIHGARVVATKDHGLDWVETLTDADGRFALGPMRSGDYYLVALADEMAPHFEANWTVFEDGSTPEKVVKLTRGTEFFGIVIDESGNPLTGVGVKADPGAPHLGGLRVQETSTDLSGVYHFAHLGADIKHLQFHHSKFATLKRAYAQLLSSFGSTPIVTRFGPQTGTVTFRVVNNSGQPLPGVKLEAQGLNETLFTAMTNADGSAIFKGTLGKEYNIVVTREGFVDTNLIVCPTNSDSVKMIRLHKLARLSGRVNIHNENWAPEGTRIHLRHGKQHLSSPVINGHFDIGLIRPGNYEVSVHLFDVSESKWQPLHLESGANVHDLSLTLPSIIFR
ncbi:MAG: carboxypeptidase regulatory-like domain-containing protein [Proteobacteria bacterium]|nr:carboxypeptidase regulatory-like domain-containing protein [Pseudomonadota bacterium]